MKKLKLNFAMMAALLGITAAFAFKPTEHKIVASSWTRTINSLNQENWVSGTLSGPCNEADDLCKATFADGYDPRLHSSEDNQAAAISAEDGYVAVP